MTGMNHPKLIVNLTFLLGNDFSAKLYSNGTHGPSILRSNLLSDGDLRVALTLGRSARLRPFGLFLNSPPPVNLFGRTAAGSSLTAGVLGYPV